MVTEDSKIKQSVDDQYTPVSSQPRKKSGGLSGFIIILILVGALGAGAWYFQDELKNTFAEGQQLASVEAIEKTAEENISGAEENYFDAVTDTETVEQATNLDRTPAETVRTQETSPRAPGTYGKPTAPPLSEAAKKRAKNDLSYLENATVVDPQGRVAAYVNEISMDNNSAGTITMSLRRNESLSADSVPVVMTVKILNAVETEGGAYQIALTQEQNQALQTSMMTN